MRILIIDIDSKIPNLALHKIALYHKNKGDEVIWNFPLMRNKVDKIYVSCIFSWNVNECNDWFDAEIGGSGWSLQKELPPEINVMKPKINIGFTTRGCIRRCPFCIVPIKEGVIRIEGDIYDIWDGKSKDLILLDNNILALFNHFKIICGQIKKEKLRVDFNQGLDCRLLTEESVKLLKSISHIEYRFAFDDIKLKSQVDKTITLLQEYGINRCNWYVLVGFNSSLEEDFERLNYLRSRNQNAFVQRYETCKGKKEYILMARWVNQHHIFQTHTYEEFCKKDLNYHPRDYINPQTLNGARK